MTKTNRALFVATVLVGSFLLFLIQPLVARMALPMLGGSPNVWNSAMLVYQALLLGGYAYAHALSRLPLRRQAMVHLTVLVLAALTLPIALADIAPPRAGLEPLWVPLLFLATVGPVFFAVSAQAPLMQRWYGADPKAGDPYWLYAASNLGSFAGLIAYPLLLEPSLPLGAQSAAWSVGYFVLVALVLCAALARWSAPAATEAAATEAAAEREHISGSRIALWLALSAVPSGLMLSTTTHLTTDIVAMPLLWVIPLGLYILSFVFAFNPRSHTGQVCTRIAPLVVVLAGGIAMLSRGTDAVATGLAGLLLLFVTATALHRRLYLSRPDPAQLTFFYLIMSAGGALGGLLTALVAPLIFDWVWEHPLLMLAAAALLPRVQWLGWTERFGGSRARGWTIAIAGLLAVCAMSFVLYGQVEDRNIVGALLMVLAIAWFTVLLFGHRPVFVLAFLALLLGRGGYDTLQTSLAGDRQRSFFGIYVVRDQEQMGLRGLTHGTTLHGLQFSDPARERQPTSYYVPSSGVGLAFSASDRIVGPNARIGVVGLGAGTLACYRKPGQRYDFFEIDPVVVQFSRSGPFTFLRECAPDATLHIGDARLELEGVAPGALDMLAIDAFSSDSIPLHLMTREAFALYGRVLAADGLLLVHISNRYIELKPMVAALARATGMRAILRSDLSPRGPGASGSVWVALSRDPATLARLQAKSPPQAWEPLPSPSERVWSDDFASILPYLRWEKLENLLP